MPLDPETRTSLLAQLASGGDQAAWSEFLRLYQPVIFNFARRQGLQDADAQDVVQVVLTRVAAKARTWDSAQDRGSFRGWLAVTVRNLAIDHFRAQQRRPGPLPHAAEVVSDARIGQAQAFDWEQRRSLFHWAADRVRLEFQPSTWAAFWQTAVQQRGVPEVAAELNMSPGAIYVARSRVLARIRQLISHSEFDSTREGLPHADR
jgi:RNA polymerase sigma factor (sigma-70 family)